VSHLLLRCAAIASCYAPSRPSRPPPLCRWLGYQPRRLWLLAAAAESERDFRSGIAPLELSAPGAQPAAERLLAIGMGLEVIGPTDRHRGRRALPARHPAYEAFGRARAVGDLLR
jgi:hypothetical protein